MNPFTQSLLQFGIYHAFLIAGLPNLLEDKSFLHFVGFLKRGLFFIMIFALDQASKCARTYLWEK